MKRSALKIPKNKVQQQERAPAEKRVSITTQKDKPPETFDIVNINISPEEIIAEYEELSTKAAKRLMTLYLSQLAVNSAISTVIRNANGVIPGGAELDDNAMKEINTLLDTSGFIVILEFALTSVGYTPADARMFAQTYMLKRAEGKEPTPIYRPPEITRKLPREVNELLDKMSLVMSAAPKPKHETPSRERKQETKTRERR